MREELDKQLCEKYPLIFKNRNAPMTHTAMCWGFEHGDGWYNIIDVLCGLLYSDYVSAKERYEAVKQYYEKDGKYPWKGGRTITPEILEELRLKMIEQEQLVPVASQVKEKLGTLRFYVESSTDEHDDYIRFAEHMSARTCEVCGKPGLIRGRGWLYTACDEHTSKEDKGENDEQPGDEREAQQEAS